MAEHRGSQQADQMKTQPTPQPGATYSAHIVPTETFEDKPPVLDACASDLAESIWNNFEQLGVQREDAEALSNVLPEFLRQMALRLGHGSASLEERDAQAFVHNNIR